MDEILAYLRRRYQPLSVILYGSYASGTNNLNSDFDALVITAEHEVHHDTSFVGGVQLDVFVYPAAYLSGDVDCEEFVQIFDGRILQDQNDIGKNLQARVLEYLKNRPGKTGEELQASVAWCAKMLERTRRGDAEGLFRWHWVLIDSLEIFCDVMHQPYFGPKKALKWMEAQHPAAFACYRDALEHFQPEYLENWIDFLLHTYETR